MMKNKIVKLGTVFFALILVTSCISRQSTVKNTTSSAVQRHVLPESLCFVDTDGDGVFENVVLEEKPVPFQGQKQWTRDYYGGIKYPPIARKNGLQGVVVLDVLIDEFGSVQEVLIKKSVSKECGAEAKRAFIASTKAGFSPAMYNSKKVKCRIDYPIGFWLE